MFLHSLNFYGFVYSTSLSTCFQYFSPADYFWVKMVFIVGFNKFFYFDRNLKLLGVVLKLLSLNTLLKIFKKSSKTTPSTTKSLSKSAFVFSRLYLPTSITI